MTEKIKILYVDDEENNLISFRANFRKDYHVLTAISTQDAFSILEKEPAQIIISDQRMPNTTGVEFLEQALKLYPDSIRLLITAYSDIELVIEAINRGQITKYIKKPWDFEKLSLAIDHCVTLYKTRIELQLKNIELQKANDELTKFAYSVSHDLRSPLTSILGIISLAKVTPEMHIALSYFEMIESRIFKLDTFIKNLIDHSKNASYESLNVSIDIKEFITSIWEVSKHQGNSINFELFVDQKHAFYGDSLRLKIIFENLISNAIKFQNPLAQNHFIKIHALIQEHQVSITLSDNGIGINKNYISSIFNLFFRTEDFLQAEGSGIGLYLVKEAITKIGGNIKVESEQKHGTTFELIIPNKKNYE
jgi:two-component system sensor histidine kinase/response regulator